MSKPRRVGRVVWGDAMITAALYADRTWEVTVDGEALPALAASLTALYDDSYEGPQDGPYGRKILAELAAAKNGTLVLDDDDPYNVDAIY
jgi:hypothetical protein